jgi:hypothetical protein
MFEDILAGNAKRLKQLGFMSAHHPTLPIAALDRRHPGLTPAIHRRPQPSS